MTRVVTWAKALVLVFLTASQADAQCGIQTDFELSQGEKLTGMAVDHAGERVLLATGTTSRQSPVGRLHQFSATSAGEHTVILELADGIIPSDPDFDPQSNRIAFAGYCAHKDLPCWDAWPGWNIFSFDPGTGDVELKTRPNLNRVQWRPKFGDDGSLYYVAFEFPHESGTENVFGASLMRASGVFRIDDKNISTAIVPTTTKGPNGIQIFSFFGNFMQLRIIKADNGEIVFGASLDGRTSYLERAVEIFTKRGDIFDRRMIDLVDRVFISNPDKVDRWVSSISYRTIFFASQEKITSLNEIDFMGTSVPKYQNYVYAASTNTHLWVSFGYASGLSPLDFFGIKGETAVLVRLGEHLPAGDVIDLRINGDTVAALIEGEGGLFLHTIQGLSSLASIDGTPPETDAFGNGEGQSGLCRG